MPENIREILSSSIRDVCRDRHLEIDVEATTELIMRSNEFQTLARTWGCKPLQDGTDTYQEAVWACYDFADEWLRI